MLSSLKLRLLFTIAVLAVTISSCTSSRQMSNADGWNYQESAMGGFETQSYMDVYNADKKVQFDELRMEKVERKVLFSATLIMAVEIPDTASVEIEKIAKQYGGYASTIGTSNCIIRVKSDSLTEALAAIEKLGKVKHKSKYGEDVTEQYLDYKIRLENAEKARKRYLELLAQAENVEEALLVEKELERLNGTIDRLKGQINRINHLDAYSTITVYLEERKKPGILGYIGMGLYYGVKWLFVRN